MEQGRNNITHIRKGYDKEEHGGTRPKQRGHVMSNTPPAGNVPEPEEAQNPRLRRGIRVADEDGE